MVAQSPYYMDVGGDGANVIDVVPVIQYNLVSVCAVHAHSSPYVAQTQVVNLPDWALGPTVVTVDLSYTNSTQVRYTYTMARFNVYWRPL